MPGLDKCPKMIRANTSPILINCIPSSPAPATASSRQAPSRTSAPRLPSHSPYTSIPHFVQLPRQPSRCPTCGEWSQMPPGSWHLPKLAYTPICGAHLPSVLFSSFAVVNANTVLFTVPRTRFVGPPYITKTRSCRREKLAQLTRRSALLRRDGLYGRYRLHLPRRFVRNCQVGRGHRGHGRPAARPHRQEYASLGSSGRSGLRVHPVPSVDRSLTQTPPTQTSFPSSWRVSSASTAWLCRCSSRTT